MSEQIVDTQQLARDIALLHDFVHGAENETVLLGGVPTPTLRDLVSTIKTNVNALLAQSAAFEQRVQRLEQALEIAGLIVADGQKTYSVQIVGTLIEEGSSNL